MALASQLFSDTDRQKINAAVRDAEAGTSAEIVPVVATASGRYDRAEDVLGLWLGIGLMVAISLFWPPPMMGTESGSWESNSAALQPVKLIVAMLVGFILGAVIGSKVPILRRLFTPKRQMTDEVRQTARSVFFDNRIHHTQAGGGLLIYVSLFEHIAVILADRQVVAAIGQPALDSLCQSLTQQLRTAGPTAALCQTLQTAGELLKSALPRGADDVNELPDALVTID